MIRDEDGDIVSISIEEGQLLLESNDASIYLAIESWDEIDGCVRQLIEAEDE